MKFKQQADLHARQKILNPTGNSLNTLPEPNLVVESKKIQPGPRYDLSILDNYYNNQSNLAFDTKQDSLSYAGGAVGISHNNSISNLATSIVVEQKRSQSGAGFQTK